MDSDVIRLPLADAARQLGCSTKTLKRRATEGQLEIVKDGSRLYVPEQSLRTYVGAGQKPSDEWQELDDLRVLFPIPELEARRQAKNLAARVSEPSHASKEG